MLFILEGDLYPFILLSGSTNVKLSLSSEVLFQIKYFQLWPLPVGCSVELIAIAEQLKAGQKLVLISLKIIHTSGWEG